jgi:hypothetical protein
MQVDQRCHRNTRNAQLHAGAGSRIQHPCRHHDDHTGRYLEMNNLAAGAPLSILPPNAAAIECVPSVTNFDFLPDMGRMTA